MILKSIDDLTITKYSKFELELCRKRLNEMNDCYNQLKDTHSKLHNYLCSKFCDEFVSEFDESTPYWKVRQIQTFIETQKEVKVYFGELRTLVELLNSRLPRLLKINLDRDVFGWYIDAKRLIDVLYHLNAKLDFIVELKGVKFEGRAVLYPFRNALFKIGVKEGDLYLDLFTFQLLYLRFLDETLTQEEITNLLELLKEKMYSELICKFIMHEPLDFYV